MDKIKMGCIAELDGDEMTRVLWKMIKEKLIEPFVELNTEYYDLGLKSRDESGDKITLQAAEAVKRLHVGVKCATITPNAQRVEEYNLHEAWPSPNGTIRAYLDGTTFRRPIPVKGIQPFVRTWKKPITIARHSYGDIYKATEYRVPEAGEAQLVFKGESGEEFTRTIFSFKGPGIIQGVYNRDDSITNFAVSCFEYALSAGEDLWFCAKDTISKKYDHRFKDIFQELYDEKYRALFEEKGITYFYTLIDDAVARIMRSEGGMIWAMKNYDGDVMSDMVASAFGSLAMMTSVLVSPEGNFQYEASHGTVTRHYYRFLKGEETSTNPVATIFAWSGALRKRGEMDGNSELVNFSDCLERAVIDTIEGGTMTGDLASLFEGEANSVTSAVFMDSVAELLTKYLTK